MVLVVVQVAEVLKVQQRIRDIVEPPRDAELVVAGGALRGCDARERAVEEGVQVHRAVARLHGDGPKARILPIPPTLIHVHVLQVHVQDRGGDVLGDVEL